ncbi:outer membrane lipoprotein chaperone LolA [Pusillimonas sp. ANT_WB101]|uniref:outer membrane lipoprotein chaperone LolA n=1 Tax=Pusillimonas sp. ANT_WB101 TaxID=2597356 RepID=UPI0011EDEC13|nr:outer membrane lipoprotein chaperone LolA [Pusillimonas sp. ANT_WB101]KAA0889942.1 outer membrane lipoprotein chaperone LolA [Pusillimonas sp. ANT_WB101]
MKIKSILAATVLAAMPFTVWSADAIQQLRTFIADVPAASGQFTQQVLAQNQSKSPQSGEFSFRRPGQFKWSVLKPYEQLIVSDGKVIYQYDPDLLQVTVRNVDQSIGASPAAILFGSGSLEDAFTLEPQKARDGLEWLRAIPRSADAGFTHVDIGFAKGLPARLELLDSFGQTTRIEFQKLVVNPKLPAGEFKFDPPPGVDVVNMK